MLSIKNLLINIPRPEIYALYKLPPVWKNQAKQILEPLKYENNVL